MAEVNAGIDDCDDGRCATSRGIPRIGDADEAVPPEVGAAIIPGRVIGLVAPEAGNSGYRLR